MAVSQPQTWPPLGMCLNLCVKLKHLVKPELLQENWQSPSDQGRLVKRGVDGLLILLATVPGVLTVQRYYRRSHILMNDGTCVDLSRIRPLSTIYTLITQSIFISLKLMWVICSKSYLPSWDYKMSASLTYFTTWWGSC